MRRLPAIRSFHETIGEYFWRPVGGSGGLYGIPPHQQFDELKHRRYINMKLNKLIDHVSLCIAEATENACVARFQGFVLAQGKPKPDVITKVQERLAVAFKGTTFDITVEELK
jgi:hypothetical protein